MSRPHSILDRYPDYQVVIGIEVHVQLTTNTKIFCSCANQAGADPNTNICIICAGYPGVLPMFNKKVLEYAIAVGRATHCSINRNCSFDRKHYFYPDLPKGYQITQQFEPICTGGYIPIRHEDGSYKHIRINRIHMEEDAGKNIHASTSNVSFVNLNRAGTPLLEIVSEPDISDAHEAKAYLKMLHTIVRCLGVSTGNMEEGAFRADTNISVRKKGDTKLGTKCELKNINSFKFIFDAIEYEIERQITTLQDGGTIRQETRLWDGQRTVIMRVKEEATDYRYFQDPDLPLLVIDQEMIDIIERNLPELPFNTFKRLCQDYGLTAYEADIIVDDSALTRYLDEAMGYYKSKSIVNWILRDIIGYLKEHKITLDQCKVTPRYLATLVNMVDTGTINNNAAKEVFMHIAQTGEEPTYIVEQKGLKQIGSAQELEKIVLAIINQHPDSVAEYKAGKERLFGFFVGKAMQATKGQGNPIIINELLKKHLRN
ncbi:MAG TPA: Asp-tRNA(Asn)/Glu-tRNA(Gln) amidotransferase subunit GatB [Candidatus Babeliales bacterium]|nr:Asp-tRNA(Asn)/Glu-tRNA(Gln) amidotransferase subunit GatB [Candidatus Babeliales bacterium]